MIVKARWLHGKCARFMIERSGFEPWPGTLLCNLGQGKTVPLSIKR